MTRRSKKVLAKPAAAPTPAADGGVDRPAVPTEALAVPSAVRERIRLAIVSIKNEGAEVTTAAIRSRAKANPAHSALIRGLYVDGKMPDLWHPWDPDPADAPRAGVEHAVRNVRSLEDVARAQREIAAGMAAGAIEPAVGRALSEVLAEERLALQKAREHGAGGDAKTWTLLSAEAARVAEALDLIVSEERRARLIDMIARELELDMIEHPAIDTTHEKETPTA